MTRDEIVIKLQPVIASVIKKYNNGKFDEDLFQEGMITTLLCVNKSMDLPYDQISKRAISWVHNRMKNIKKVKRFEYSNEEVEDVFYDDINLLELDLDTILEKDELDIFNMLKEGSSYQEIMDAKHKSKIWLYKKIQKIKEKINEYLI